MAPFIVKLFIAFLMASAMRGIETSVTQCPKGCRCSSPKDVKCEGDLIVLDYVPRIPETAKELCFKNNALTDIYMDTFENVTFQHGVRLEVLDLSNNGIVSISTMAFSRLTYLKTLDLSKNFLKGPDGLQKALVSLKYIHIQSLTLQYMDIADECVPPNLFQPLTYLNTINRIDLSYNHLNDFDFQTLTNLTSLQEVVVTNNRVTVLSQTPYDVSFPGVQRFDFRSNSILEMPFFCDNSGRSIFSNLTFLLLDDNFITSLDVEDVGCLKSLTVLSLSKNPVSYIPSKIFDSMPSLTELKLNNMLRVPLQIASNAFRSSSLKRISLSGNKFTGDLITVFSGLEHLQQLDLSGSNLGNLPSYTSEWLQSFLPQSLTELIIRNARLPGVPRIFLPSLVDLNLGGNEITKLSSADLTGLPNLTVLILDGNRLTRITKDCIPETLQENIKAVEFGDNPLLCTCEICWFQEWLFKNPSIYLETKSPMRCIDTDTSDYVLLGGYKPNCGGIYSPYTTTIITVSVVGCLIICVAVVLVVWYRQKIRMWLYICGRRRRGGHLVAEADDDTVAT